MSKRPVKDLEILEILGDYNLFLDCEKYVEMPFCIDQVDNNHLTAQKGESELKADVPFGNTTLECEVRHGSEFDYSFKILTDRINSRMLFRMDEGNGTHWNRHLNIPIDQQQVPTPHFHKKGNDGIDYAYTTDRLKTLKVPLNIHDGFWAFCEECHINQNDIEIRLQEQNALPLEFEPEVDPLKNIQFP